MPFIKVNTYSEAIALNERVTNAVKQEGILWKDGITNNYCNPYEDESGLWIVEILEGYERFFTTDEINQANSQFITIDL